LSKLQVRQEVDVEQLQRVLSDALPNSKVRTTSPSTVRVGTHPFTAAVRIVPDGGATTFKVSGEGFILIRIANELSAVPKVRRALNQAFPTP